MSDFTPTPDWECPAGVGDWFITELVNGGQMANDGCPDGRVASAARAILRQSPQHLGEAIAMGLYLAASAVRKVQGDPGGRISPKRHELDCLQALQNTAEAARKGKRP
ncbi:MAG: hypothetical protein ABFS86_16395 [Planctomycetota bacterium]